jgi:hypothetical protein
LLKVLNVEGHENLYSFFQWQKAHLVR